jgi:tetratricopeptide (TPR) repeat protein
MVIALAASWPATLPGQGFSGKLGTKTTIVLDRKLPAAVALRGNSFSVKATASRPADTCQKLAADKLQSTVETALIRYNSQLQLEPGKPDNVISVRVLNCNAIAKPQYSTSFTGKTRGQQQQTGVKVNGGLTASYQARTRAGATVDAESIDVKYEHEFNNVVAAVSATKKIISKIPVPGRKRQQEAESEDPQTFEDVVEILVNRMTERVAARLVNTNERVEAYLARGSAFDENNRYAEAGQWTKYVEAFETMQPLPNAEDDSYRLYNIGVGDEALGYKAETPAAAKKYFEQAVIQYRKAGEANPHEKYFIEPVNRIEIALEHYRKLAPAAAPKTPAAPKAPAASKAPAAPDKATGK